MTSRLNILHIFEDDVRFVDRVNLEVDGRREGRLETNFLINVDLSATIDSRISAHFLFTGHVIYPGTLCCPGKSRRTGWKHR